MRFPCGLNLGIGISRKECAIIARMSETIQIHPSQNNPKLLKIVVDCLRLGGVIAYPTDSGYALGCSSKEKEALERIKTIRHLDDYHPFTLICRDVSEVSHYAELSNPTFRILKRLTPGPYTFILEAGKNVPQLAQSKRKKIGVRIPDHPIPSMIAEALQQPLLSTTLILPGSEVPLLDAEEVAEALSQEIDLIIDGGYAGFEPTSILDLSGEKPIILRLGSGDVSEFQT